ncbi:MAG: alpha/beta hydrolase [Pseudomonadota bacterium]
MRGWEGMTPAALDAAYANADHIPGADTFLETWPKAAAAFRARHVPETLTYGADARQRIDLFRPGGAAKGLVVFIHGGYWRRFDRRDWSHLAAGALSRGYAVALPGYVLAPKHRIGQITAAIAKAIDCVAAAVEGPIGVAGHSAGGHLAARMVMADAAPDCADRIATCVPISPLADLRPLVPQSMNADLCLDPGEAARESPALGHQSVQARLAIHVGADERPAFLWQADLLGAAWNGPVRIAPGRHHFDVIDALTDPASALIDDLLP